MGSEQFSVQLKKNGDIQVEVSPGVVRIFCRLANEFSDQLDEPIETADVMIAFVLGINAKVLSTLDIDESDSISHVNKETLKEWVQKVVGELKTDYEFEE